ncbi:MAG: aspartate--tRNA(Asn) ligase [Sulfolobales archaeon]|nr:aspartate--tRNA(Asn) ligase [Sulfolobales archaeon]
MVRICGWIVRLKVVGRVAITEVVTDLYNKPVVVAVKSDRDLELFSKVKDLPIGTAVCIDGEVSPEQRSKRGVEYLAKDIRIYAKPSESMPVDLVGKVPALLDTRIKYRYLLIRNPVERSIIKIRALVLKLAREFLENRGFIEVHTPKIVAAGAEGGATLFQVKYFESNAYLSQSPQLYKQMLMTSFSKVYEITPYFRAEKFNTKRHLNESWGIDVEQGFIDSEEDVMKTLEELVAYIVNGVIERAPEELELLGVEARPLSTPFKRIDFREAVELLMNRGLEIPEGEDLSEAAERELGSIMAEKNCEAYFIKKFPWTSAGFYYMRDEEGFTARKFDLDYKGLEVASGGQREHRYEKLVESLKLKGLSPSDFEYYLEAFKYGMPPHGGFGLGVERLLMSLLNLDNIRLTTVFVRDRTRLTP